ncbi:MAG: hypothetical protein MAG794_00339 [Gammaproteobacteria bacterium]|nr:hypothetical protein [Gammaproteobacteria bacterium]
MGLGPEIIDLVRPDSLHNSDQVRGIGQVSVVENEIPVPLVGILIKMIHTPGIEQRGPALDAMHHVALLQQKFREIRSVLACNPGN